MLAQSYFRLTSLVRLSPQATSDRLEQGQGLGGWGEERESGGQLQTQISLRDGVSSCSSPLASLAGPSSWRVWALEWP